MIDKTILVCCHGLFQSLAHRLSRDFTRVLYFRHWAKSFPTSNDLEIGTGYENIERVNSIWCCLDEVDIFCFPDNFFEDEQEYLRSLGKSVWGAGRGSEMENYRWDFHETMQAVGLPTPNRVLVTGITALRKYLQKHEDKYIKVSLIRDLMETWHHDNYKLSEGELLDIETKLGGKREKQEFIVEDPIPDALEVGYDGYCIDGQYPKTGIVGVEIKDCGYAAQVKPYQALHKDVRFVNSKLSDCMRECKYRGFWSTEIRIGKDGTPYLIDPTCRMASPAGECYLELFGNLGEIIEGGADGQMIEPKMAGRFAVQAMLTMKFADERWEAIEIPDEIRQWFKLYHSCREGDTEYIVKTDAGMIEVGSVVAIGNTLQEADRKCREYAEQAKGFGLKCNTQALDSAQEELAKV